MENRLELHIAKTSNVECNLIVLILFWTSNSLAIGSNKLHPHAQQKIREHFRFVRYQGAVDAFGKEADDILFIIATHSFGLQGGLEFEQDWI